MMDISVVMPTYNRKEQALKAIKSFSTQTYSPFEMVIVDQGPDFISNEDISNLRLNFALKYIQMDEPGLTRARNAGIANAIGEIVLFCDDDIVPDSLLIERHLENYKDKRIGGIGGQIISPGKRRNVISPYPKTGTFNSIDANLICNFHLERRCEIKHVKGCNMSFRKDLLIKAGFFDESLKRTAYLEEADMSFKIRRLGYKLIFDPRAVVRHLELTYGGCQTDDFNEFVYWLYFGGTLFYLRYFSRISLPFFLLRLFSRTLYYVVLKKDVKIIVHAKRGFVDGLKKYFKENC